MTVLGPGTGFPQESGLRSRDELILDLLDHVGGEARPEAQARAGRALDSAVREFNSVAWKFNRMTQSITLVADTADYTLATDFRSPLRAETLDSNSKTRTSLHWVPWQEWVHFYPDQSTGGSLPQYYTARNAHETGKVTFDPFPTGTLTYPTVRMNYHRRILLAQASAAKLNVPVEVENGIFNLALANLFLKSRDDNIWAVQRRVAEALRIELEAEHRDYADIEAT